MMPMGDFSLVPSFIVLAVVLVVLAAGSTVLRRRSRRLSRQKADAAVGGAPLRVSVDELVKRANIQLVQMDDAIRAADDELQFARAEFGDASVHDFAEALDTAKKRASEAFALKQRLDDSVPDTEQQQRDWSKRILTLSDAALALVTAKSREVGSQRRLESSAPQAISRVRDLIANGQSQIPDAATALSGLATAYAPRAYAAVADAPDAARAGLDEATALLDEAAARLEANTLAPVSKTVQAAEAAARQAISRLEAVHRMGDTLAGARTARAEALTAATTQLAEATRLRDTVEDPSAAARIAEAAAALTTAVAAATTAAARAGDDPVADVDALDAASARLDETLAVARTAQQRLDSARAALEGAFAIAESHIAAADDTISARRGRVGTDARTRLAAATRELQLARLESDPVAALDAARRAGTLATDADALARYDTLHSRG